MYVFSTHTRDLHVHVQWVERTVSFSCLSSALSRAGQGGGGGVGEGEGRVGRGLR